MRRGFLKTLGFVVVIVPLIVSLAVITVLATVLTMLTSACLAVIFMVSESKDVITKVYKGK